MGIKFSCPACGRPLNVKSELAGKRGRCPKCQAKIDIPAEGVTTEGATGDVPASPQADSSGAGQPSAGQPTQGAPASAVSAAVAPATGSGAPSTGAVGGAGSAVLEETKVWSASAVSAGDPISEAPTLQWYAMPPGAANQYGPATGEEFRVWMQEGRIPADALVWRQDWPDWKRAGSVFPQLATPAAAAITPPAPAIATAIPTAAGAAPTALGMPAVAQSAVAQPAVAPNPLAQSAVAAPGMFPTEQPSGPVADGFPIMPTEPAARSTAGRSRAYRPRSNTGPIIAIVVLLLAMIPLTFFVWKVVRENFSPVPASATSAAGKSAPDSAGPDEPEEPASSDEPASSKESAE